MSSTIPRFEKSLLIPVPLRDFDSKAEMLDDVNWLNSTFDGVGVELVDEVHPGADDKIGDGGHYVLECWFDDQYECDKVTSYLGK